MTPLTGSITALITPFTETGVDSDAFQRFVDWQIAEGVHGLVPCGTTGESPTLSSEEHCRVIELCVEAASGRVPVIAGVGSNSTAEAEEFLRHAQKSGADAGLVVAPYYNRPNQEGLFQHFNRLAEVSEIPLIIYNIPKRSGVDISVETLARLAQHPNVAGVKDATGDLARVPPQREQCGEAFLQLSGEDMTAVGYNAMGGVGCISVTSNIAPKACAAMQAACLEGDYATALAWQDQLAPLHDALFSDSSPAPTKFAASLMGFGSERVRLPLTPANAKAREKVETALERLKARAPDAA